MVPWYSLHFPPCMLIPSSFCPPPTRRWEGPHNCQSWTCWWEVSPPGPASGWRRLLTHPWNRRVLWISLWADGRVARMGGPLVTHLYLSVTLPSIRLSVLVEDVRNGGASCNFVSMGQMSIKSSNPVYVCLAGFVFLLAFHDIFVYSKNMYQLVIKNICLVKIFFNNLLLWIR